MTNTDAFLSVTPAIAAARDGWRHTGAKRPPFAEIPDRDQESVWDFPRPPRIEDVAARLTVKHGANVAAETVRGKRVLETSHAPTFYFPAADVDLDLVAAQAGGSHCEWKGISRGITVAGIPDAGWQLINAYSEFAELAGWMAFYPSKLDCFVGDERARPQGGSFYGGWVTDRLAGPIKGAPGSGGW
ncbi:MAG: DUF427 domain-containing protein [Pseudomonadota bacterium]